MIQKKHKIGVIAGTPVDTKMGVDFITNKGHEAFGIPTAASPHEQNLLQFFSTSALTEKVKNIIQTFQQNNIFSIMIYCNSLSSAVDLNYIRKACPQSRITTPLEIYANLALQYKSIIIWAANGQCLAAIEKIFYENNPSIEIMGVTMLPVIKAIEAQEPPAAIIEKFNISDLIYFNGKAECLVLGCTHLPYLKNDIQKKAGCPIIDPAEEMLSKLMLL